MKTLLERYPFQTVLSLEPLIASINKDCAGTSNSCRNC